MINMTNEQMFEHSKATLQFLLTLDPRPNNAEMLAILSRFVAQAFADCPDPRGETARWLDAIFAHPRLH